MFYSVAFFLALLLIPAQALAVGFERISTDTSPPIQAGVWYPSPAPVPQEPNTPFRQALALGGAIETSDLPMVVLSHGDGGWMGGHAHTAMALAEAGYVAVALEHPGNNSEDESASPREWLVTRPRDISSIIDHMLSAWTHADRLDPSKIGVFGFSAGGYTALAAGVAAPDFSLAPVHCDAVPEEFACRTGLLADLDVDGVTQSIRAVAPDPRIGAVSAAAPAFGFAFPEADEMARKVPTQLWSGEADDRVPHDTNAGLLEARLAGALDVHVVEDAGHFAFMAPCNPRLEEINPRIWQMVCVDAPQFDRASFHEHFNRTLIDFFDRALGRDAP